MSESVMVGIDRTIMVAPGVFAAGHLGELTAVVPFELVDAVLEQTGCVQRRTRMLPSRVGVYLVLAMVLFPEVGLAGVWSRLTGALRGFAGVTVPVPSGKALRDLRRRVSVAPVKALFEHLAGPTSWPGMPGCRYRGLRMVAIDGCSSFKAPDSPRNRAVFRLGRRRWGNTGWPGVQLLALVECGTRALLGANVTSLSIGEIAAATPLLAGVDASMLLLADAAFDADKVFSAIAARGAQFLIRASAVRKPAVLAVLPDGSFLTRIGDLRLRIIDAHIAVTGADGTQVTGRWRLVTSLTDHRTDPAEALVKLYHQRWEIETCFFGLRHTLTGRTVLRSGDPFGIEQEMWALACIWQILVMVMTDAAATRPGFDPDRGSFTIALAAARDSIIRADHINGHPDTLTGTIGAAVLHRPLDRRRPRIAARVLKAPGSRYQARPGDPRPPKGTAITGITTQIQPPPIPDTPTPHPTLINALHHRHPTMSGHVLTALAILHTTPDTPHAGRAIARTLGITGKTALNAFGVALNTAARRGHITKTAPGTYTITSQQTLTTPTNP